MGRGIFTSQLKAFERIGEGLEHEPGMERREGFDKKYGYGDALKSANELTELLDNIAPKEFSKLFAENVKMAHCLHKTTNGVKTWYHTGIMTAIVKPRENVVLSCMPEFCRNEDKGGEKEQDKEKKQDCERNAFKRWLKHYVNGSTTRKSAMTGKTRFSLTICLSPSQ
jgi:hypothetical protein